ncbi:MAG: DegV family protein [Oscillospiraceae bacterium]|nr:DegV family protein [Oscillospiraceae bacterium]
MNPYIILADATCDLNESFQKQYDIVIVPGHVILPDKSEISAPLTWDRFTREEFYNDLKKHPNDYKTAPPNAEEFRCVFTKYVEAGYDILAMSISGGISGAPNFMRAAKEAVLAEHPLAQIQIVDSLRFGPGFGLMVIWASRMRASGKSLEENVAWLEENRSRFHQAGWLDDLSFVAKKGRITNAKAFFGTLAGVKPIGEFDYNGLTTVIGKVRGAKAAYELLLNYIENTIENPGEQTIFLAHTCRLPQAEEYKRMIEERFHPKEIFINDVFPSCGVNIGPGLMAAYYVGKPISKDLAEERALFSKFSGAN